MPKPNKPPRKPKDAGKIELSKVSKQLLVFNRISKGTPTSEDTIEALSEFEKRMSPMEKEMFRKVMKEKLEKHG